MSDKLAEALRGLRRIVEEIDGAMDHGTWRDENRLRFKDTPEWVSAYNTLAAYDAKREAALQELADLGQAWDAAPGPAVSEYRLSDKKQKLLDTVRGSSQWDMENDRMKAPAPWSPPPEADRPDGYECLAQNSFGIWRHVKWSDGQWLVRGMLVEIAPTAFAPLPSAQKGEAT